MNLQTPAAVHLRELHRQELLDVAAQERLASTTASATPRQRTKEGISTSIEASVRSEVVSRLSLLGRFARVATTTGRPLMRPSPWS